jgi:hypothetical protein
LTCRVVLSNSNVKFSLFHIFNSVAHIFITSASCTLLALLRKIPATSIAGTCTKQTNKQTNKQTSCTLLALLRKIPATSIAGTCTTTHPPRQMRACPNKTKYAQRTDAGNNPRDQWDEHLSVRADPALHPWPREPSASKRKRKRKKKVCSAFTVTQHADKTLLFLLAYTHIFESLLQR